MVSRDKHPRVRELARSAWAKSREVRPRWPGHGCPVEARAASHPTRLGPLSPVAPGMDGDSEREAHPQNGGQMKPTASVRDSSDMVCLQAHRRNGGSSPGNGWHYHCIAGPPHYSSRTSSRLRPGSGNSAGRGNGCSKLIICIVLEQGSQNIYRSIECQSIFWTLWTIGPCHNYPTLTL